MEGRVEDETTTCRVVLTGVGGQGVIFLTRLLAQAAVHDGYNVIVSETHGMSQRGGSVLSHIQVGEGQAPLVPRGTADLLLGLDRVEALRNLSFVRPAGIVVINSDQPFPERIEQRLQQLDVRSFFLPADTIAADIGFAAIANTVMAGFAVALQALPTTIETLETVAVDLARRGRKYNLQALAAGYEAGLISATARRSDAPV